MNTKVLAKVIETTREAPENIGTAFKTIIARMAQVKEAGSIIEDGVEVSINKVQFFWVSIRHFFIISQQLK